MKLNLVIVDDSRLWLSIAQKLAQINPLIGSIEVFNDSMDAWIHLQKSAPSLVMTDIEMPGMNGLSFLEMFGSKLPFISSSTKKGYAAYAEELGCVNFLSKPFSKLEFDRAVEIAFSKLDITATKRYYAKAM